MAFDVLGGRTPTTVRNVTLILASTMEYVDEVLTDVRGIQFVLVPADQDERDMKSVRGNLVPHLTQAQIDSLQGFMDDMRGLAEGALPVV